MSTLDEEAVRQRRAFASLARGALAGPDCPAAEELWDAAAGRLSAEERRTLIDHTAGCASCAEDWRLARQLTADAGEPAIGAPGGQPGYRVRWGLAAAAAVLALVAVPVWLDRVPTETPETLRQVAGSAAIRSLVPTDAALQRSDCILSWSVSNERAVGYDLVVASEELQILAKVKGLDEPRFRVPEEALSEVPPGGRVLWRVEATLATGQRVASATFTHRLQ